MTAKPGAPLNDLTAPDRFALYLSDLVTLAMTIREGSRPEAGQRGGRLLGVVPDFHRFFKLWPRGSNLIAASKMPAQMLPCLGHVSVDRAHRHAEPRGDFGMG